MALDWYDRCLLSQTEVSFRKEAGLEDWFRKVFTSPKTIEGVASNIVMYALVMLMNGSPLGTVESWAGEAAVRSGVSPQVVQQTVKRTQVLDINKMKNMSNAEKIAYMDSLKGKVDSEIKSVPNLKVKSKPKPVESPKITENKKQNQSDVTSAITLENICKEIIKHENLIPFQTPFRIDEAGKMRAWKHIQGFEIDWEKNAKAPKERRNFIFLKNQEDLLPAVIRQFRSYQRQGYNFEEGVRKFDQTGANGKLKYLKEKFPNLDVSSEISAF